MLAYVGDFETTVEPDKTRVWAWGTCQIGDIEDFEYGTDIEGFIDWCKAGDNKTVYIHNLKFDGPFILDYLLKNGYDYSQTKEDNTFNTIISDMGQFYKIEIIFKKMKKKYKKVEILDSLKKLPFTVEQIGKDFGLPIQKVEVEKDFYTRYRAPGHQLTEHEIHYLKHDVQTVAIALGLQFAEGLTKMTTGSDALHNYKTRLGGEKGFRKLFPVLPLGIDKDIRYAYKGGFTYLNKRYEGKDVKTGIVFDVNSLYPAMMLNKVLPYGRPLPFKKKYVEDENYPLYIQVITCRFKIKPDHIPTIQLKKNRSFVPTEYIESSGLERVTLVLTNVDLQLFFDQYKVYEEEYEGGWKFQGHRGFFDEYLGHWGKIKEENEGARRTWAKLMMNSLYGKFASRPEVLGKYPDLDDKGVVRYKDLPEGVKDPVYTAMGAFITAYARELTIRTAQSVYGRFIYADTDSIHLEGEEIPQIDIHKTKMGSWKYEGTFRKARFIRAKTYIEDLPNKEGEYSLHVTCAGMPKNVKKLVTWENFHEINEDMLLPCRDGFYPGKLLPKRVPGGIVLQDTNFTIIKSKKVV